MTADSPPVPSLPALSPASRLTVPALFADSGEKATKRLVEYLTAHIRNPNTRTAYARAVRRFDSWCQEHKLSLEDIEPVHGAAYVEQLGKTHSIPTVKQHLAALRVLGDYLVTGQVIATNPFAPVRGPKYSIKKGKTVVLAAAEMRLLLDSINMKENEHGARTPKAPEEFTIAELRDRALIAVMGYSFARISAVLGMNVGDYRQQGKRCWVMLHEKNGKDHQVPCHHTAVEYLDAYLAAAGIAGDLRSSLFRRLNRHRKLAAGRLDRREALAMVKRRAVAAGLSRYVCNHSFRATGLTVYLQNGGDAGEGPTTGGPRVAADNEAVRPDPRRDQPGRGRAHPVLDNILGCSLAPNRLYLTEGSRVPGRRPLPSSTRPKAVADVKAIRKGQELELVYKIDGDTLTVAMCLGGGKKRPTSLDPPKEGGIRLTVLKRVKE